MLLLLQAVIVSYLLNPIVPEGFSEPWKLRGLLIPMKFIQDILIPIGRIFVGVERSISIVNSIDRSLPMPLHNNTLRNDTYIASVPVSIFTSVQGVPGNNG